MGRRKQACDLDRCRCPRASASSGQESLGPSILAGAMPCPLPCLWQHLRVVTLPLTKAASVGGRGR